MAKVYTLGVNDKFKVFKVIIGTTIYFLCPIVTHLD